MFKYTYTHNVSLEKLREVLIGVGLIHTNGWNTVLNMMLLFVINVVYLAIMSHHLLEQDLDRGIKDKNSYK